MKKILFLLLLCATTIQAQTYQNPTFGTVKTKTAPTVTTAPHLGTVETDGTISKITPENLPTSTATTNALDLKTTLSAGAFSGFAVTDNGNGTINVGDGIAYLRATNDQYAPLIKYPISAYSNIPLVDNTNNYVVVSYNGGSPALVLNTTGTGIDTQTNSIVVAVARVGSTVHFVNLTGSNSDPNAKIRNRYLQSEGISRATGLLISSTGLKVATTAGITYSGLIRLDVEAIDTNTTGTFTLAYNNGSAWTRTTGLTDINNTQYNNAGTLTTMANNKYRTDYAYILVNSPSKLYVIMGNTEYNSLADAQAAPTPSILPVELQVLGIPVGRIIVQKSGTTLNTASPFITAFTGSTAQNHNDLAGLQGGVAGYYGHTSNVATAAAFTNYYGDVASSGIPQPKTLANTRTEIVTTAAVNAAKPNILTGTGTTTTIPKFTSAGVLGNSIISETGSEISVLGNLKSTTFNSLRMGLGAGSVTTNVSLGNGTLINNIDGDFNVAIGFNALNASNTTQNVAIGFNSMALTTSGGFNTGIGIATLYGNLSGAYNSAFGHSAGLYLPDNSTVVTRSDNSIFIGYRTSPLNDSETNQIVIGNNAKGLGSNTTVIGNSSTTQTWLRGNLTVGTSTNNGNIGRFNGKVDVNELQLNTTPATASGTPPLLTWNSTTKNVESVPYSSFASPTDLTNATTTSGIITTAVSITNTNNTDTSLPQNGKTLYISNGANNINYTVNGSITASFVKGGTGSITFVQGSGRTMVAANGTLVFNGAQYSTASVVSFGTTDIVYINNF